MGKPPYVFLPKLPLVHSSNLKSFEKFLSVTQVPELEHQASYYVPELSGLINLISWDLKKVRVYCYIFNMYGFIYMYMYIFKKLQDKLAWAGALLGWIQEQVSHLQSSPSASRHMECWHGTAAGHGNAILVHQLHMWKQRMIPGPEPSMHCFCQNPTTYAQPKTVSPNCHLPPGREVGAIPPLDWTGPPASMAQGNFSQIVNHGRNKAVLG